MNRHQAVADDETAETNQHSAILPEPQSWRDLLGILVSDSTERTRVARELDIGEVTLKRWIRNETTPRPSALRPLLLIFPEYRDLWMRLITKEYKNFAPTDRPAFASRTSEEALEEARHVPLTLYEETLELRSKSHPSLWLWSVCSLVLRAALEQLDTNLEGAVIWALKFQVSPFSKEEPSISCLRLRYQFGTPPWRTELAPALLVGAESLAGYSITSGRTQVCQNISENPTFLPLRQEPYAESCAAFPLTQGERMAGCLFISSTQTNFFIEERLRLLQHYAHLVSLAFRDEDFFTRDAIHLRTMPATSVQRASLVTFRQRVTDTMNAQQVDAGRAEEMVWAQLAEEFAALSEETEAGR